LRLPEPTDTGRSAEFSRIAFFLLMAVLVLSPLPLGSNRPLSEAVLLIFSFLALLFWSLRALSSGQDFFGKPVWLLVPALLALLWAVLQMLPLPTGWAHPVWPDAGVVRGSLSVDVSATLIGTLKLAAYGALFWLATQAGRSPRLARRLLGGLTAAAGVYAFYALFIYLSGNTTVVGLQKTDYLDSLTGTFINRNAFAASCGMGLLGASGLLLQQVRRTLDGSPSFFSALRALPPVAGLIALVVLALLICLLLSTSRAGLASAAFGLVVLWAGLFINRTLPRRMLLVMAAVAVVLLLGTLAIAGSLLLARLAPDMLIKDDRMGIWAATMQMIRDHPLTGQGLNSYDQLFPLYRSEDITRSYTRAHSTYLELAAELGLPAALLFFLSYLLIGVRLFKGVLIRRHHAIYPVIGLAVLAQAAAHSLVDFSFQTPANAAGLAILLGLGVSQSWSSREQA
jgi:O-antigen ligase